MNVIVDQIRNNFDPRSIASIIHRGPHAWRSILHDVIDKSGMAGDPRESSYWNRFIEKVEDGFLYSPFDPKITVLSGTNANVGIAVSQALKFGRLYIQPPTDIKYLMPQDVQISKELLARRFFNPNQIDTIQAYGPSSNNKGYNNGVEGIPPYPTIASHKGRLVVFPTGIFNIYPPGSNNPQLTESIQFGVSLYLDQDSFLDPVTTLLVQDYAHSYNHTFGGILHDDESNTNMYFNAISTHTLFKNLSILDREKALKSKGLLFLMAALSDHCSKLNISRWRFVLLEENMLSIPKYSRIPQESNRNSDTLTFSLQ